MHIHIRIYKPARVPACMPGCHYTYVLTYNVYTYMRTLAKYKARGPIPANNFAFQ